MVLMLQHLAGFPMPADSPDMIWADKKRPRRYPAVGASVRVVEETGVTVAEGVYEGRLKQFLFVAQIRTRSGPVCYPLSYIVPEEQSHA